MLLAFMPWAYRPGMSSPCTPNTPVYFSVVYGALVCGITATLISPAYQETELDNANNITRPKVWFTISNFEPLFRKVTATMNPKPMVVLLDDRSKWEGDPVDVVALPDFLRPGGEFTESKDPERLALLCYSSGTTGLPKAVALTHKNLVANLHQCMAEPDHFLGFTENDTLLAVLPFFHIYGVLVFLMSAPFGGAKTVTLPKFDPPKYLELLQTQRVTIAHVAPPIVQFLLKHPAAQAFKNEAGHLKEVFCGAAPLGEEPAFELKAKLNLQVVRQGYGMTELSPVACVGDKVNPKPGAVGLILPNIEVKLVSPEDGKCVTERGDRNRGEIWIRGPNVMKGYHGNTAATAEAIDAEGFMHTGDVAYMDDDDQLWIVDRCKELIKVKGYQVVPAELEAVLITCPRIKDAAVIGVAAGFDYGGREGDGQIPKAFVVRGDETLTESDVKEFVRQAAGMAEYKYLAAVEFLDVIPKSASGKILRKDLRKREEDAGKKVFA